MFTCPRCGKALYNRKLKTCEFCHLVLPESLILSDRQINKLKKQMDDEDKKFKEWKSGPGKPDISGDMNVPF